jgi:hypothetical protein
MKRPSRSVNPILCPRGEDARGPEDSHGADARSAHPIRSSTELRATKNCKHPRKPRRSGGVSAEPHPLMPECNGKKWGQRQDFPIVCRNPARRLLPLPRSTADGSISSIAKQRLAPRAKEDRQLLPAPPNELSQSAIKKSRLVSEINSQKTPSPEGRQPIAAFAASVRTTDGSPCSIPTRGDSLPERKESRQLLPAP